MLGFLLDIELYVCPRALCSRVCVCDSVGVLHAIFSAAAAVCGGFVGCDRRKWFVINIFRTYIHDSRAPHGVCSVGVCTKACACVSCVLSR